MHRPLSWTAALLMMLLSVTPPICAAEVAVEWEKIETKPAPLQAPNQIMSPAIVDKSRGKSFTLTKDGKPIELDLPREGKDSEGNALPKITARLGQDVIWVDINGDNKGTPNEIVAIASVGYMRPVVCELKYDDGTTAQYSFCFKHLEDREKFLVVRNCARMFDFQKTQIVLIDDNGNGKYNDIDVDAIIVGDNPVSFVGKYIMVGDKFYELLVHAAGTTVELRPAPKMEVGVVDIFGEYTPPAKGENLRLHTVIITGPHGSFSFDERRRTAVVPAGAYDLSFGIFERARETMFMRAGEKTSFYAVADKTFAPKWGGPIKTSFDTKSDGTWLTVDKVRIFGVGTEEYVPESWQASGVNIIVAKVLKIPVAKGMSPVTTVAGKKMDVEPNGELKNVRFERLPTDEYEVQAEYVSGILGRVKGAQRINYVNKRK